MKSHRWAERDAEELPQLEKRVKDLAGVGEDSEEEEANENGDNDVSEDVSVLDDTVELLVPRFDSAKHETVFRLIGHNQATENHPFGVTVGAVNSLYESFGPRFWYCSEAK